MAAGWLIAGLRQAPASSPRSLWVGQAALFAFLGMLPDIDFLFGTHSTYTHSIGAATIVGVLALVTARSPTSRAGFTDASPVRWAIACALAYGSHIVLDALGDDTTPPIGIMALWPLTSEFYQTDLRWFMAISRRYWLPGFWTHNLLAVAWEVVLLAPVAAAVAWLRRRG
jgi:membrane-bound metal-dependent hydrolase YbcI (DUF457 family)